MSTTITYPPAQRITPTNQPVAPCWCWNGYWNYWSVARPNVELYDYTHWVPAPPPEPPDIACEREVARLKGQLEAAEQHVKILTEQRDTAHDNLRDAQDRLIRAGLASPRPAAPKVQKVLPWKASDVPLGCWVRSKSQRNHVALITQIAPEAVIIPSGISWDLKNPECIIGGQKGTTVAFGALAGYYEHSTDGGKTWSPAGRVVYEEAA
jgi:hypothetical protein